MARESGWWMSVTQSLPLTEHTVEVEGLELYYRTGGSGPPLLLLHGGTLVGQQWNPFLDALGRHYTVIVPDLPGHGRSLSFPPEGWSFPATGRIMFELLDALGVEQVRGAGHSAGAATLLHMAERYPTRVEAMVLVGGAHHFTAEVRRILANWYWDDQTPEQQERFLARHPGGIPQSCTLLARLRETDSSCAEVSPERLERIPTRTLLVFGDRDWAFPVEVVLEAYRALPNAMLWVVPGKGHDPPWSSRRVQAEFSGIVHDFFEGKLVE
jgi:pimeloyl-ACP methyl ester carboxylesterase